MQLTLLKQELDLDGNKEPLNLSTYHRTKFNQEISWLSQDSMELIKLFNMALDPIRVTQQSF
jgi:hypothetical protein